LNNLVSDGMIKKIVIDEDNCRFDHIDSRHSHFICCKCGKIIDVFEDYFVNVKDIYGNIVNDYDIYFNGICKDCQKEGMNNHEFKRK
jgi:Fe2+ or Zn2+ uptake regulation protein